jgi:hypothetical protein
MKARNKMNDIEIAQVTLDTPDGPVTLLNTRDIREVIEKYIGYEFASYISEFLVEVDEEEAYAKERACTDADAIAEENDYLRTQLLETQEILTQVTDDITQKSRLNKNDLFIKLLALVDSINTVL